WGQSSPSKLTAHFRQLLHDFALRAAGQRARELPDRTLAVEEVDGGSLFPVRKSLVRAGQLQIILIRKISVLPSLWTTSMSTSCWWRRTNRSTVELPTLRPQTHTSHRNSGETGWWRQICLWAARMCSPRHACRSRNTEAADRDCGARATGYWV